MAQMAYITLRKLAAEVGVSSKTVKRWTQQGLRIAKLGKTTVTTREWIEEFRREERPVVASFESKFLKRYGRSAGTTHQSH